MTTSIGSIGSTITGGIQDIAALLPLLGTQQCEVQVSSALTRGFLYAAATPMSIFGSLGMVRAGCKTLVACFSLGRIEGAKTLSNMGFEPQGLNLSLIMVESHKSNDEGCYIVETRVDKLIKDLNIDKKRIIGVSPQTGIWVWNAKMVTTTAFLCTLSVAPYILLNLKSNHLNKSTRWVFPALRATGGFITTTFMQFLIQRRITSLADRYIKNLQKDDKPETDKSEKITPSVKNERCFPTDIEASIPPKLKAQTFTLPLEGVLQIFLLLGLIASVVGYVGCFSVVQNSRSGIGTVSWLCLEAGLSVLRMLIWASNPKWDDAPPLEFQMELDKNVPLPSCNKDHGYILKHKILPLTRAENFLSSITSFAGLIDRFTGPDLSLYYTLTRTREPKLQENETLNAKQRIVGERNLYITVFDHKERTARIYTREKNEDHFYSTTFPVVDLAHGLLEVTFGEEIDINGDPISGNREVRQALQNHYTSILEHIYYRISKGVENTAYGIENGWTMEVEDTQSEPQRKRGDGNGESWRKDVTKGKDNERHDGSSLDNEYLEMGQFEEDRQNLDGECLRWNQKRMEWIAVQADLYFNGKYEDKSAEYRVDGITVDKETEIFNIDSLLAGEQEYVERLFIYEVVRWENLYWSKMQELVEKLGDDRQLEKERLVREWRANCWKRLDRHLHASADRLSHLDKANCTMEWQAVIREFIYNVPKSSTIAYIPYPGKSFITKPLFMEARNAIYRRWLEEMQLRMDADLKDIEFRLKRGSQLGRFDQFWYDEALLEVRYSRSKWFLLNRPFLDAPLELYSNAIGTCTTALAIILFGFGLKETDWIADMLRDSSRITSISLATPHINDFNRTSPLFISKDTLDPHFSALNRHNLDPVTYFFLNIPLCSKASLRVNNPLPFLTVNGNGQILVSFVAPLSLHRLILRLKHFPTTDIQIGFQLGSTESKLTPSSSPLLMIDDITLHPSSLNGGLFFEEGRNDLYIYIMAGSNGVYFLYDIELLDEQGNPYGEIFQSVLE